MPNSKLDNRTYSILSTMDVMIFVFVSLLLVADIFSCATAFKVKPLKIGTSGTIPCDHVEDDSETRLVQWYKSKRSDAFVNGDPSLTQWADGSTESLPNYHMENTTFSLVIEKATSEDEGLYKCSVESGDLFIESNYYTRTVMYALPQMDPEIIFDLTMNRVHCTVEHVQPLIYPEFNFDDSHASTETYAVLNEDGTYTTSSSCTLPQNKSASRVDCSLSYLNYQRVGSLDLRDTTTDSLMENKRTTLSPMSTSVIFSGDGCRQIDNTAIVVCAVVIGLLSGANFIMLIRRTKFWGKFLQVVDNSNAPKESEVSMMEPTLIKVA